MSVFNTHFWLRPLHGNLKSWSFHVLRLNKPSSLEKTWSFLTGQSGRPCRSSHWAHSWWCWDHAEWMAPVLHRGIKHWTLGWPWAAKWSCTSGSLPYQREASISNQPCKAEEHTVSDIVSASSCDHETNKPGWSWTEVSWCSYLG